jgi:plastocyanin
MDGMRKLTLVVIAAALGALAVILPAVAGSEASPTVTAVNGTGLYAEQHSWSPPHVTVGEGGSVTIGNPTAVAHGVHWISSPATPVCSAGVPVGTTEAASGTEWSGSCTFAQPGTYTFYCTVHGAAMSGTITVASAAGEPPVTTPVPTAPAPTTPAGPTGPGGGAAGQPGASAPGGSEPGLAASPFAGAASKALKLAAAQRGNTVRGSLAVSSAGARGRLEVDVLAKAASLAGAGHGAEVRVGKLERGSLSAGTVRFAVALNARARHALARRGRLGLTVEIALTPVGGRAARLQRSVVMRRAAR